MTSILDHLNTLRRPRLLIQAARIGSATYRRDMQLGRLLDHARLPRSDEALAMLIEMEDEMNAQRMTKAASYCAAAHVDLLIAMMGEARLLRAAYAPYVVDLEERRRSRKA